MCCDYEQGVHPFTADFAHWHYTTYYQSGNSTCRYLADKLFDARERAFQSYIERTLDMTQYSVIFCSTCYYFPLQTAYRLSQKYHIPFLVDLRDIAEQWGNIPYMTHRLLPSEKLNTLIHRFFVAHNIRQRNKVLAAANHVITISPWHRDLLRKYNSSTHLIYNGFDEKEFYPKDVVSDKFIISYSGKIYNLRFRDPKLLFEALQQLLKNDQIDRKDIEVRFHIDNSSINELKNMVAGYDLTDICHISPYIPKDRLIPLLHLSSILLVLTCKSTPEGSHGIMGTKFFEALGVEKPVLCIRSDEECLSQVIEETHAGLAGTDSKQVAEFILAKYHEWRQKGFTRQATKHREEFSRETQSRRMEELCEWTNNVL